MNASRMVTARLVFVVAFSAELPVSWGEKPRELLHVEEMRKQISSAEVEYVLQTIDGPKFKSDRLFAGDFLTVNFGDENGRTNAKKRGRVLTLPGL